MMRNAWDKRFATKEYVYGTEPNTFFKTFIDGHAPGTLLLPGEGEGRNAVYAALRGWTVHAFDSSRVARKKARKLARTKSVSIKYDIKDVNKFHPVPDTYDLVGIIFLHLEPVQRSRLHRLLVQCLRPGGHMILEAFEKKQIDLQTGGPRNIDYLYRMEDILGEFSALRTIESIEETIILDSNLAHQGEGRVIRYIGQKKMDG